MAGQPPLADVRAGVYVLQRIDRQRFKVGWALEPLHRVQQLPEYGRANSTSLTRSCCGCPADAAPSRSSGALHKSLAPYRARVDHRQAGHSEWFDGQAHATALTLLTRMPADGSSGERPRPYRSPAGPGRGAAHPRRSCEEVWWALEDLWLRLAACCAVSVEVQGDVYQLVLGGFRYAISGAVGALRPRVFDVETYTWRWASQRGEFVRLLEYRNDDLVCTLTPFRRIGAWAEGADLVCQVRALLVRLQRLQVNESAHRR
jgi:hypothetical protein